MYPLAAMIVSALIGMAHAGQFKPLAGKNHVILLVKNGGPLMTSQNATTAQRVGCLNAKGLATAKDCAVYSDGGQHGGSITSGGECNFSNKDIYGCGAGVEFPQHTVDPALWVDSDAPRQILYGNLQTVFNIPHVPSGSDQLPLTIGQTGGILLYMIAESI